MIGSLMFLFFIVVYGLIGSCLFKFAINTWLVYANKAPNFKHWHGFLLAFVPYIGQLGFVLALITWIIFKFIGTPKTAEIKL